MHSRSWHSLSCHPMRLFLVLASICLIISYNGIIYIARICWTSFHSTFKISLPTTHLGLNVFVCHLPGCVKAVNFRMSFRVSRNTRLYCLVNARGDFVLLFLSPSSMNEGCSWINLAHQLSGVYSTAEHGFTAVREEGSHNKGNAQGHSVKVSR